jgi:transcriptional regulator with XRE-family HTH domain
MGMKRRPQPARLAEKLRTIRLGLGLSQEQMVERLDYHKSPLYASQISLFEQGKREPPVLVLLYYARVISTTGGGEFLEAILDDEMELPDMLPADPVKIRPRSRLRSRLSKSR